MLFKKNSKLNKALINDKGKRKDKIAKFNVISNLFTLKVHWTHKIAPLKMISIINIILILKNNFNSYNLISYIKFIVKKQKYSIFNKVYM